MTSLTSRSPSNAFETPDAGGDYFTTEAHYLSFAGRITAALRRGAKSVLVIGDPPPDPLILSQALGRVAAWWYAVIVIRCGPELSRDQLLRVPLRATAAEITGSAAEAVEPVSSLSPLVIFDDADRLSDGQLENICESLVRSDLVPVATVFFARPDLISRLERFGSSSDRRTARFSFQELGREEIAPFIWRQLFSGVDDSIFTPEAITAIVNVSGGDPGLVNCLSRLMLEFADAVGSKPTKRLLGGDDREKASHSQAAIDSIRNPTGNGVGAAPAQDRRITSDDRRSAPDARTETKRLPSRRVRHYRAARPLWMAGLVCLIIGGFLVAPQESVSSLVRRAEKGIAAFDISDFAVWIKPVRDEASTAQHSPQSVDVVAPLDAMEHERPAQAEATPPVSRSSERPADKDGVLSASPVAPENSPKVIAERSLTDEPAPAQPTSSDGPSLALTSAPTPTQTQPATTTSAAATAPSAETPGPNATAPSAEVSPARPQLSAAEIAALVRRGDELVGAGDISSARLFYERAAQAGDGRAALRLGATFDPAFLVQANLGNAFSDQGQALSWYRRARDLGEAEAARRLGR